MEHYFLGLDVGIENIGYALTKDYEVMQVGGKRTMGVLSFESANTAVDRRTYRATRRRLDRRRYRIALLQELFNDEIMAIDKNFLRRLGENDLYLVDRNVEGKYSLFNDADFNDVVYYKQYPTIYHLREKLMNEGTNDIRLLYLAIHHIIKYRGHFLLSGEVSANEVGGIKQLEEMINKLNRKLAENRDENNNNDIIWNFDKFSTTDLRDVKDLICGTGDITKNMLNQIIIGKKYISKRDKKNKLNELFGVSSKLSKKIIEIVMGGKVNLTELFGEEYYAKEEVKGFTMADEWELIEDLQLIKDNILHLDIIDTMKQIYDWVTLNEMLKGKHSLSSAMIEIYETHKRDLQDLKKFIKDYGPNHYDKVFGEIKNEKGKIDDSICNYSCYIGGGRYNGDKIGANGRYGRTCTQDDFYKFIKKIIESVTVDEAITSRDDLLERIANKEFMPKIVSKNNSTIPYQLNMMELEKILDKAKQNSKFTFLNNVDYGWTIANKIKSLLTFRVPYYVGPMKEYTDNDRNKKYAWAVRKESGAITPWNIDDKIDVKQSNETFIRRMTNKCTYLKIADTLPRNSILFSKFTCLNEINSMKINGEAISCKDKKAIFDNVFCKKNPTIKNIKKYLIENCGYEKDLVLSGINNEIKSSMKPYMLYKSKLGSKVDTDPKMIERIIVLSTIHEDSQMLENSIREEFGEKLTEEEIKSIKGYKFNGWGSLSAEFLAGYKNNGIKLMFDGELLDIIDIMYEYNYNLQQIIFNEKCNYAEALEAFNLANNIVEDSNISYKKDIAEYPCSPSVKKCVWQSFKLVNDIVKQTKILPDMIFIESCRENNDFKKNQRTSKRRDMIAAIYDEARKKIHELKKDKKAEISIHELDGLSDDIDFCQKALNNYSDGELKKENLYLYFMQLGKDMYTGKTIDLNQVLFGNMYDHDHIIPQAMIKDDSFTNLVLVAKKENAEKSRNYPLESQFRQTTLWKKLYKIGLMSNEKYSRLIRQTPITDEEQEKFINRQLVETSQTVVLLRDLLNRHFAEKNVKIVLSKAANVSMFRKEFNLTKSREVNDFHHAWDAYLNIIVGNILNKEFNRNWFIRQDNGKDKSYNFLHVLRKQATANNREILNIIDKTMNNTDFQMVKLSGEKNGSFYSEVLKTHENDKDSCLIPMCDSKIVDGKEMNPKCDTTKYGGYKTANTAYFVVADSIDKKGSVQRNIIAISIFDDARIKNGKITYKEIFDRIGLKDGQLAKVEGMKVPIIKTGSLLDFGAYCLRLAGMTGKQLTFHNANQLIVSKEHNRYIKELSIIVDKVVKEIKKDTKEDKKETITREIIEESIRRKNNPDNKNSDIIVVNREDNLKLYDFFIYKLSHNPYRDIPTYSSLLDILQRGKVDFEQKDIYAQILLLLNIIKAFQCNAQKVDVSALSYVNKQGILTKGGTGQCGIKMNNDITEVGKLVLINQSMSGLKEKRIQLNLKKVDK